MHVVPSIARVWRQTISVAVVFWAACLALVAIEVTVGAYALVGGLFFLSIPLLVAFLTWVNIDALFWLRRRSLLSVLVLGVAVLTSASAIILIGLLAAANLKHLIVA